MIEPPPNRLRLTGAEVLGPAGLVSQDLTIDGARVSDAGSMVDATPVAMDGLWVLPGLIDLHGDGFERHVAPRRGAVTDLARGLMAVETELAASGITSAWLAQFWSWEGGMRGPAFATDLAQAVQCFGRSARIDMRLQLRVEQAMTDDHAAILDLIERFSIDYIVFNDHLPHDRLAAGQPPARLTGSALKARRTPEDHLALMQRLSARRAAFKPLVASLGTTLAARGVALGTHDDRRAEDQTLWQGARPSIAEFPVTREAAEAAHAAGRPVVMGAPNVVRGGSHNRGSVAAETLIGDGIVSALASDYHYPAMIGAAMALTDRGVLDLAQAWSLISAGPAGAIGLTDRGRIAPGLRADLVVLDPATRRVVGTLCAGRFVLALGPVADALLRAAGVR